MHTKFDELRLTGDLPSSGAVGLRVLELTRDDGHDPEELLRCIEVDPALTGRLLKLANDSRAEADAPARTAREAADRLGRGAVHGVALGFTLVSEGGREHARNFGYDAYWRRALASAVSAEVLGRVIGRVDPAAAFTCALLSDVGQLAFASVHAERYSDLVLANPGLTDLQLARIETRALGIDHFEASAAVMRSWGLPREFQEIALLRSHGSGLELDDSADEDAAEDDLDRRRSLLAVVRGARTIAEVLTGSWDLEDEAWRGSFLALDALAPELALDRDALLALCDAVLPEWSRWGAVLGVDSVPASGFEQVALELDRRGGLGGAPAGEVSGAALEGGDDEDASVFQPELDLPVQVLDGAAEDAEGLRVLLVDDDTQMLRLIAHHLRREGFEVLTAEASEEGLACALEQQPQILITDWMMPGMSGLELTRTLRRSAFGAKMYMIVVTARGEDEQIVEAFEAGADDYVVKPFNPKVLLSRVRAAQRMIQLRERVEESERGRLRQVAELGIVTRKLRAAALTDALTELPNRRYAMKRLKQEWEAAARSGRPLSVIMCDIDHFKSVNDEHGHDVGDVVLKEVANALQARGRASDVLCRIGGEEFLVINVATDLETSAMAAERLRAAVAKRVIRQGSFHRSVTLSLGVAQMAPGMRSVDDLIKAADEALYVAKEAGRNRVETAGRAGERESA